MRLALVSNWHEQCGNAGYARDLWKELVKYFDVGTFHKPEDVRESDVALINWHPSRITLPPALVRELQGKGMKVIVILQNSHRNYCVNENDPLAYADGIVAHEDLGETNLQYQMIPHGIPIVDELREMNPTLTVGIAGFPYAWKRFDVTARAARDAGGKGLLIAPTHDMGDVNTPINDVYRNFPEAEVVREWLPVEEVVRRLSTCAVNVCWYQHMPPDDLVGQSGSVRMAIASRRPIIVSEHPKLASVRAYEDEVYLAKTENEVTEMVKDIWARIQNDEPVKVPCRILRDMGWTHTGALYRDYIEKVAA